MSLGLGLLVGAVLHGEAWAQAGRDTVVKRDTTTVVRDSLSDTIPPDTAKGAISPRDTARRDTILPPFPRAPVPLLADPTGSFVWQRGDVFGTGALTVADLLDRVPGLTVLRSGWISQPAVASFVGDPGRVRVFFDGLELNELDPRMRGLWDLTTIPLWALESIRVERGASEIRIHMRSWQVDRTTPYTRTDIYTGDQSTNLYRGYFGRRYRNGEAIQAAGQQYGTSPGRTSESSDQLGVLARVGLARRSWAVDAVLLRLDRNRGRTTTEGMTDTIPRTESTRTDAYLRGGWGSREDGFWIQALASASRYTFGGAGASAASASDTARSQAQYVVMAGYTAGPVSAAVTQRYTVGARRRIATPSVNLGFEHRWLTVSGFLEGRNADSARHFELAAVVRPLSYLFLSGAAASEPWADNDELRAPTLPGAPTFLRGEAGVRVFDLWLSGGVMSRSAVSLGQPSIFKPATPPVIDPALQGTFASVRGRVWKALYADAQAIQWQDEACCYRPRHQTRSELYLSTALLDRFPTGNFHVLASAVHEYRSASFWPDSTDAVRITGYRTISTLLQFKILDAFVFWNFRNLLGERYTHIPGYRLPRQTHIYGVRWEFWN